MILALGSDTYSCLKQHEKQRPEEANIRKIYNVIMFLEISHEGHGPNDTM